MTLTTMRIIHSEKMYNCNKNDNGNNNINSDDSNDQNNNNYIMVEY